MCQMFCGWRLIGSKPSLVSLGSGTLEIDAITGECVFQGKSVRRLRIAEEIRGWLQEELATNEIPIGSVSSARVAATLSFSVVPWNESTRERFYSAGNAVRTEEMNRCRIECVGRVATDKITHESQLTQVQEWPVGWPVDDEVAKHALE